MQTSYARLLPALLLSLATGWPGARAGHHDWEDDNHSYDRARRASEQGEILSLAEIYTRVAAQVPGRILDAELEKEHGRWVYELRILDPDGRLQEVALDARTGLLLPDE